MNKKFYDQPIFDLRDKPKYSQVEQAIRDFMKDLDKVLRSNTASDLDKHKTIRDFIIVEFVARYGRRIGEVPLVRYKDVDLEREVITFTLLKKKKEEEKYLTLKILPELIPYLRRYLAWSFTLFGEEQGNSLIGVKVRQARNIIYAFGWRYMYHRSYICPKCEKVYLYDQADLNNFYCMPCSHGENLVELQQRTLRPHAYRHAVGTYIQKLTGDIEATNRWLGHSDIRTTQVYAKYDLSDITEKVPFFADRDATNGE